MEYQKFKLEDDEVKKVELKDLYNSILLLNQQFYWYYKNMDKINRSYRGDLVNEKIAKLLDFISNLYFDKGNSNMSNMFVLLKEIEFQIRILFKIKALPNKAKCVLQKILSTISMQIKLLNNELCK